MILECNAKFSFYDYYDPIWEKYKVRANDNAEGSIYESVMEDLR